MNFKKHIIFLIGIFLITTTTNAQFGNILEKVEKKVKKKVDREIDKGIDKGIDEVDKTVKDGVAGDKKEETNKSQNDETVSKNNESNEENNANEQEQLKLWSKYNFVPGDKIIFEDNLTNEESGEFPSRWDLLSGNAENASLGPDNVISMLRNSTIIKPLMETETYLPEVFTLEFDAYFDKDAAFRSQKYVLRFFDGTGSYDLKSKKRRHYISISWNGVQMNTLGDKKHFTHQQKKAWQGGWKHIAIAFNKRSLKIFIDQDRLLNVPNLGYKPQMFSIGANFDKRYIKINAIKNIRLAEGGKKLYDRIVADGKFVTRGILFDVNKSTIKPESMGVINKILKLMQKHPDLKFRIEGHTDSDGDESFNQKLSEERALAVKDLLISSGIEKERLESKGYGETKPVADNSTPEGKANNRRVEFIKI